MRESGKNIELDPLRREAVAWVQQLISGKATLVDLAALKLWRSQSPAHAAAFDDASRIWKDFGAAGQNLRRRGQASAGLASLHARPMMSRRVALGGLATASVAAVAAVHPPLALWPSLAELKADYRTATGEQCSVAFGSDISIFMNTQTSIALRTGNGAAEQIELIAGEASFATTQLQHALAVIAADGRTVGGAARFDVRRVGPSVCVSCLDGEIRIEQQTQARTITGGQQVRYDGDGFGRVVSIDPDIVAAWRRGVLVFRSTPLAEAVEEINRYRPGKIIVLGAALGRSPVSGRFRIDRIDQILGSIERVFGAKARSLPGGIVLLS